MVSVGAAIHTNQDPAVSAPNREDATKTNLAAAFIYFHHGPSGVPTVVVVEKDGCGLGTTIEH